VHIQEKTAMNIGRSLGTAALAAALVLPFTAGAQQWPAKPVRLIVPFETGGGTDIQARLLAKSFFTSTGKTFVVDNRSGAGGLIGAQATVDAIPNGYTLLFTTATIAINPTLMGKRMKFSPVNDLAPVSLISSSPLILVVSQKVPAKTVKELIEYARNHPGKVNVGVNTPGSTSHLSAEMLNQLTKIDAAIIPYKGGGPSMAAVISGEVQFLFATAPTAAPQLQSGRIRALAVTTAKQSPAFPDLPTMSSVIPGFESDNWYAMFFPRKTPKEIVARMNAEIRKALSNEEVRTFFRREGLDPVAGSPEELTAHLQKEIDRYAKVIKAGNITVQ
jgi:tripartite-type tricarboxylate transporter receptor subunit TctC